MTPEEKEHQEFIEAAAAVYAWMSAADGSVTRAEITGFIEYLNNLEYVDEISEEDFANSYLTLIEAFEADFDDGLARAQARIESFAGHPDKCADLIRVARKALVADSMFNDARRNGNDSNCSLAEC